MRRKGGKGKGGEKERDTCQEEKPGEKGGEIERKGERRKRKRRTGGGERGDTCRGRQEEEKGRWKRPGKSREREEGGRGKAGQ